MGATGGDSVCTCMPCFPSSSEIGSTTQFQQRANYLYAAQGDRAIQAHTSSEVQKQPRSHGIHYNDTSGTTAPAIEALAFVTATVLMCLCVRSVHKETMQSWTTSSRPIVKSTTHRRTFSCHHTNASERLMTFKLFNSRTPPRFQVNQMPKENLAVCVI